MKKLERIPEFVVCMLLIYVCILVRFTASNENSVDIMLIYFQKALSSYKIESGHPSYHALAQGAKYILENHHTKERTVSTASGSPHHQAHEDITFDELKNARAAWTGHHPKLPVPKKESVPV